ncbi:RNA polymerase sigma-70 factor (ECF subfamily) [Arcticibacter pallidicorallinus]|uniref:RNA polymerase sigma-70 factor (ECF subfamily) n=1 Tax=Arcticibacter pallidicorallinus TaxID=1259464 RepID=A0A2T0TRR0_9SPHI|nr:RNA polymerase sigma-70 factor [Arcticibacter pallidicorallinus]PRY48347.1 RNA polymerase sigma-70 factor (ECF subfamily) [Arcticibacter pallidicorallinus]
MHFQDDHTLLSRIREGDENAFSLFYEQHWAIIHRFVKKYVKCQDLSNDVTQDIFVRFWEGRDDLPEISSLKSYLFVVARNAAFNVLKKASVQENLKEKIVLAAVASRNTIEDDMLSLEYLDHLKKVVETLPAQTQKVFSLCREEEKSYQEVSQMLGISKDAVKKHMVRSMKLLRVSIQNALHVLLALIIVLAIGLYK